MLASADRIREGGGKTGHVRDQPYRAPRAAMSVLRWGLRVRASHAVATIVGVLFAATFLLGATTLAQSPRLSLAVDARPGAAARVSWVLPGSTLWDLGVRAGDRVLALDGRPPVARDSGSWNGQRLLIRTLGGARLALDARRVLTGGGTWPLLALSPWFLLLGTLLYLRARPRAVARAAYGLFAAAAFALALAPATDADVPLATVGEHAATPLFAACFALFFCTFPALRGSSRLRGALLLPPLAVGALAPAELVLPDLYPLDVALRALVLLVYLLLGATLMVRSLATARDPAARRGLAMISAATAASILPFALLYLLPTLGGHAPILTSERAILALAVLPAGFAYAILRHDALQVRLLQRWLFHGVLWGAAIGLYAGIGYALIQIHIAELTERTHEVLATLLLAALAGTSCARLVASGRRIADRVLFKDHYDYRRSLREISRDLSLQQERDAVDGALLERLRQLLHLRFVVLLVQGEGAPRPFGAAGTIPAPLLAEIAAAAHAAADTPRALALTSGDLDVLAVPLRTRDALVGHLCLGPKRNGEPFRADDVELLATLGGHLAALLRNAALLGDLRGKVRTLAARDAALNALNERLLRAQEEERRRLAADIHDEPLQTALTLQRLLRRGVDPERPSQTPLALSRELIDQLRAACTAMRPAALDDLGLLAALDRLAHTLGAPSGVTVMVEAEPELAGTRLDSEVRLVLYRAAQEAINNSLRHGGPSTVRVTVRRENSAAILLVADDGRGFVPPEHLHDLAARGHLGLMGLRERVQQIGGRVTIDSTPGAGTALRVEVPLKGALGMAW